jgi:hypothetical protein
LSFLLDVADRLFAGAVNEEKTVAVFLLENITGKFGDDEFKLLESWLPRISNWSDHDPPGALSDRTYDWGQTFPGEQSVLLGEVAEPLVAPGSVCGPDSRGATKNVFVRGHPFV